MSLINDALKRAKQTQEKNSPPLAPGAPMRPADGAVRENASSGAIWILLGALVMGLAAAVLIFVAMRGGKAKPVLTSAPAAKPVAGTPPAPTAPAQVAKPPPLAEPAPKLAAVVVPKPSAAPAPVVTAPVAPPVLSTPSPPLVTAESAAPMAAPASNAVVPAPVVSRALPKLQGIFYRPDRPSALLDGKTIWVGGRSGEFLVVAITRQSATLVRGGETNVLSLGE